jgi:AhpD family alkylhydroperoxidase
MGDLKEICGLDLENRNNLDAEMTTLVRDIEKKYGFMPHFVRLFASDNRRLKAFMTQYMELMREDSGLTHLEHEMIALVSAATNGCVYCTAHHGALMRAENGDALFAEYLSRNYKLAELSPRHRAMLDFCGQGEQGRRTDRGRGSRCVARRRFRRRTDLDDHRDRRLLRRRQPHRPGQWPAAGSAVPRDVSQLAGRGAESRLTARTCRRTW